VVYFQYKGFIENEKSTIFGSFVLLVFMVSVYQAIIPLFICGVFACFLLIYDNSEYELRAHKALCFKLLISLVLALIVYFLLGKIVSTLSKAEKSEYLGDLIGWRSQPIGESLKDILITGYIITLGRLQILQPFVAKYARTGMSAALQFSNFSRIVGSLLLLPATILFLIQVNRVKRSQFSPTGGGRSLYVLAGIGVPLSIMMLSLVLGNRPPLRTLWALPFAFAFMLFFLVTKYKRIPSRVVFVLALIVSIRQVEVSAQLHYSDYLRYQDDVRIAGDLDSRIKKHQEEKVLSVALIGQHAPDFRHNFIKGQVIGDSFFEYGARYSAYEATDRGLDFMETLGFNYEKPSLTQMDMARAIAETMPSYPLEACIKKSGDLIIVKLSSSVYEER
jgi:hypothetical protein